MASPPPGLVSWELPFPVGFSLASWMHCNDDGHVFINYRIFGILGIGMTF